MKLKISNNLMTSFLIFALVWGSILSLSHSFDFKITKNVLKKNYVCNSSPFWISDWIVKHPRSHLAMRQWARGGGSRFNDDENIIDAEIVGEDVSKSNSNKVLKENEQKKLTDLNPFTFMKNTAKGILSGVGKVLENKTKGILPQPQSTQETVQMERKRRQRDEYNSEIDRIFENTGMLGGIAKGVFKNVYSAVIDNLAEAANDIEEAQTMARRLLERDSVCLSLLGSPIRSSQPSQSSSNSYNINGVLRKSLVLVYLVSGPLGAATAQLQVTVGANGQQGSISIDSLVLQFDSGRLYAVNGGGRGGGGRQTYVTDIQ